MTRTKSTRPGSPLVAAAALLAGCATTDSTYSSLPPAPEHPGPKAPMDRATVTIPGSLARRARSAAPATRAVHRPARPHSRRLCTAGRRALRGRPRSRALSEEPRFSRPHVQARCALPVLHRAGTRAAQPAARTGAAAGRGKRVQSGRLFAQPRLGPVAVHPVLGQALRPRAELVDRRASRRHRSHGRRTHLPAVPQQVFRRRLVPRDRRLQRRRRHRQRRRASQPVGGIADRLLQPEPAGRNPRLRAEAARHQPHRA